MRIAETPPAYCVSCHSDCVGKEVVDFEAYYDGPVIEEEHYKFQIDDLMICRDCLVTAGKLIGIDNVQDYKEENAELGEAFQVKLEENESLRKVIKDQEDIISELSSEKIMRPESKAKQVKGKLVEIT